MPPTINHYDILQVPETATHSEIKDSYKRLALLHHPDKNAGDPQATLRFQKLQASYEVLGDPPAKARYDRGVDLPAAAYNSPGFYEGEADDNVFGPEDFFAEFPGFPGVFFDFSGGSRSRRHGEFMKAKEEEATYLAMLEQIKKDQREEQQRQREAEKRRNAEKVEARRKELAEEKQKKEEKETNEKEVQAAIWATNHAITVADKQKHCLHTDFWPKQQHKNKMKCGSCQQRRGMVLYKCPHCSILVCQLCLHELVEDRVSKQRAGMI